MSTYETIAGSTPDMDEQHEARTIVRSEENGTKYMMTEIGDGTFVQWSRCTACKNDVAQCKCSNGPQEPDYIEHWRVNRFKDSFTGRNAEPPLPEALKQRDRTVDAVLRKLRAEGWTLISPQGDTLAPEPDAPESTLPTPEEVIRMGEEKLREYHPSLAAELDREAASPEKQETWESTKIDSGLADAIERVDQANKDRDEDSDVGF